MIEHWPEAQNVVRVQATEVFPNCPRYIHRMQLVERSRFVPREGRPDAGARLEAQRLGARRPTRRRPRGDHTTMSSRWGEARSAAPEPVTTTSSSSPT